MKLVMFFLTAAILQVSATSFAQKITLNKTNVPLERVINDIREQSGYDFFYNKKLIKNANPVSVNIKNEPLAKALEACLQGQELTYEIKNNAIIIMANPEREILERPITGVVTNGSDGKALVGVTVQVKGTKTIAQTDDKGRFSLVVPDGGTLLVIRYMGYKTQEITIADFKHFVIRLVADDKELDQVVVTGIFQRPVENFTGSAVTLKGEELRKVGVTDIFKNVATLDPAFNIVTNNITGGDINQLPDIQIRGQNSFPTLGDAVSNRPNQPLFILDGFEVSLERIKDLDMNMISSIVILKDASATTIYGSRGANGVMVVTTLQPEPGKFRVSVTNDMSISTPDLSVYRLLDSRQKLDFEQRVGIYSNDDPSYQYALDQLYNKRLKDVQGGINTDWRSLAVQTGINNRTTVSLSGGENAVRYGLNVTANAQNGVMKKQDRTNYQGQFDFSYQVNKFRFSNSARYYQTTSNGSPYGSFSTYLDLNPYWAPYNTDGTLRYYLEEFKAQGPYSYETKTTNPLVDATLNSIDKNRSIGFQDNLNIRYDVHPSLFIETKLGITKELVASDLFLPGTHTKYAREANLALKGEYTKGQTERLDYEFATYLNYNKRMGKSLLLGTFSFELGSRKTDGYSFTSVGFPTDNLDHILYATQYKPNSRPGGTESTANRMGFLLNGNYSYDNRYLADLSVRRDGSSAYGTDRKFGDFWSVGLGWNLHNEAFFKEHRNINRLKLRASYGSTGSLEIPAYASLTKYIYDVDNVYDGGLGIGIASIGNPDLGWQEKRELNVGTDMELFNTRLTVRAEYYNSTTNQAITQLTLAPSIGFDSYYENYGKINNKGVELAVQYKVVEDLERDFTWMLFANGLRNTNTLLKISDNLRSLNESLNEKSKTIPNFLFEEGKSTTSIFAVPSLGINPANGREIYLKKDGSQTYDWSAADKIAYGNSIPKVQGAFGTNIYYRGFELGLALDYRYGGQIYNQTLVDRVENVNPRNNVDERAYNLGWAKPGDVSQFRRISVFTGTQTFTTTRFVEDENTVNLNSLSFGYLFRNQLFMQRIGFSSLRVRGIMNDVARFSTVRIERGKDNPFARIYSLTINASF
ncbi:SusC/RagA family TonB-linked outer membrane protein [Sphingobacterium faecale]|uniref:SusC/RagA family TonB-linked outer membrane protein n=1 Tax=Sphingobacterium faecale TaxID=2803775 RepID=A0ABS1R585_9SPHI|nr:SusC/RagA family TonB-linked outer membrane protein [Sphingobacterium faecale]MBL1409465.1 SusC/RagA family TonB-linked outer membrane protein [Sphingobacterium faecale]